MNSSFSRRAFLKRAALGAGALSATCYAPNLLRGQDAGKKVNCVQIGCGGRAMAHLDWVVGQAKEHIIAIVDPDEKQHAKVKKYLKEHEQDADKVEVFTDYRRMYDKIGKSIDAVFIATPNHHHAPASMLALELGKAVY